MMQLPFFYEPTLTEESSVFVLSSDSHKHAVQVLRMKNGDALHLTNGKGLLSRAIIVAADKKNASVKIESVQFVEQKAYKITIAISLLKNASRLEWFLEKATELGITNIALLQCHRTEKQHYRFDRLQGVIIAAMLQSRQCWLPVLLEPQLPEAVIQTAEQPIKLMAHCEHAIKIPIHKIKVTADTILLIGPEGDFTPDEITTATKHNFTMVSLGSTRLRTETAGVAAAAVLLLQ